MPSKPVACKPVHEGRAPVEWFRSVFHFAAMPWLIRDVPFDPFCQAKLEKHEREILLVAKDMLGFESQLRTGSA